MDQYLRIKVKYIFIKLDIIKNKYNPLHIVQRSLLYLKDEI